MTGKEYLAEFKNVNHLIEQMREYIQTMREQATSVSHRIQAVTIQQSPHNDKLADWVSQIVDAEDQLNALINRKLDMYGAILKAIMKIPDFDQAGIMMARYLQAMKWNDVACSTGFSVQRAYELHSKGVKAFEKIYEGSQVKC